MPTDRMINSAGYIVISHSPKARTVPTLQGVQCGRCWKRYPLGKLASFKALRRHTLPYPNMEE